MHSVILREHLWKVLRYVIGDISVCCSQLVALNKISEKPSGQTQFIKYSSDRRMTTFYYIIICILSIDINCQLFVGEDLKKEGPLESK